jgi:hypothetical protein
MNSTASNREAQEEMRLEMYEDPRPLFVTIGVTHHYAEGRSKQAKRNLPVNEWESPTTGSRLLREMGEELALRIKEQAAA